MARWVALRGFYRGNNGADDLLPNSQPVIFKNFKQLNSNGGSYTFNGPATAVIA